MRRAAFGARFWACGVARNGKVLMKNGKNWWVWTLTLGLTLVGCGGDSGSTGPAEDVVQVTTQALTVPEGQALTVLSFEDLSMWSSPQTTDLLADTTQTTQGAQALSAPPNGYTLQSVVFDAADAGIDEVLLVDLHADGGPLSGNINATLTCGTTVITYSPLSADPLAKFCGLGFNTVRLIADAIPTPPTGSCSLELTPSAGPNVTRLMFDNIHFDALSLCDSTEYVTPPAPIGSNASPDGSPEDPFVICTLGQFNYVADTANSAQWAQHFRLGADLNLCSASDGSDVRHLGDTTTPFIGAFDGAGYTLSGFRQTRTLQYTGLFQVIGTDGVVKNLNLTDFHVSGVTDTGLFDWTRFPNIYDNYKNLDPAQWGITQIRKKGLRDFGASLAPEAAHHLSAGSDTLGLRMDKSSANALAIAEFCQAHPKVRKVFYPGLKDHPQHDRAKKLFGKFSYLLSIELDDSIDCFDFLNALQLVFSSSHLGDNRTLGIPVAHTIYFEMGAQRRASMGVADSMIRLSVGIEDTDDLLADFAQALAI